MTETATDLTAKAIRVALAVEGKSQRWLADELGETTHWVSRRMSGKVPFDTNDLDRITRVFRTDYFTLLGFASTERAA